MRASALPKGEIKRGSKPMAKVPYREKLKALRERAGVTQTEAAKCLGFAYASGYRYYEDPAKIGDKPIPDDIVRRLAPILLNRGTPPITMDELNALTERMGEPIPVKTTDARGLLIIRYRVEPGTFVRRGSMTRMLGGSKICPSPDYPAERQFVAVDVSGDELHCVENELPTDGRRCLVAVPYDNSSDLVEVVVAKTVVQKNGLMFVTVDGMPVKGDVLGVIIGAYVKE